jgi:hypothetical protein
MGSKTERSKTRVKGFNDAEMDFQLIRQLGSTAYNLPGDRRLMPPRELQGVIQSAPVSSISRRATLTVPPNITHITGTQCTGSWA